MQKMPTLFIREFDNYRVVKISPDVAKGCEWVLSGEGVATEKLDGTCTWFHDGHIWKRYDAKHGKPVPDDAIKCQEEADPVTGHLPCWVPVYADEPSDKWFVAAYKAQLKQGYVFEEGQTYELIGKHIRANPYNLNNDIYCKHGEKILSDVPRDFDGIRAYLESHEIEGIVFHRGNGEMCKIKRSDFGFGWNNNRK